MRDGSEMQSDAERRESDAWSVLAEESEARMQSGTECLMQSVARAEKADDA